MSKLDEIETSPIRLIRAYRGETQVQAVQIDKNDFRLLVRAVRQLGASHKANMKHSLHAGHATKCGICKAVVEIDPDVLELDASSD